MTISYKIYMRMVKDYNNRYIWICLHCYWGSKHNVPPADRICPCCEHQCVSHTQFTEMLNDHELKVTAQTGLMTEWGSVFRW